MYIPILIHCLLPKNNLKKQSRENRRNEANMKKRLNYKKVIHSDAETGEVICETEGATLIEDNQPTPEELRRKEFFENGTRNLIKVRDL